MSTVSLLLNNLPALWSHEGVTANQRESLVQEVFDNIIIDGNALVAVKPKGYLPTFICGYVYSKVSWLFWYGLLPHLHHNNILSNLIRAYFKIKWYSCIVLHALK